MFKGADAMPCDFQFTPNGVKNGKLDPRFELNSCCGPVQNNTFCLNTTHMATASAVNDTCKGATCTIDDAATCCSARAVCNDATIKCNTATLLPKPKDTLCAAAVCVSGDFVRGKCCKINFDTAAEEAVQAVEAAAKATTALKAAITGGDAAKITAAKAALTKLEGDAKAAYVVLVTVTVNATAFTKAMAATAKAAEAKANATAALELAITGGDAGKIAAARAALTKTEGEAEQVGNVLAMVVAEEAVTKATAALALATENGDATAIAAAKKDLAEKAGVLVAANAILAPPPSSVGASNSMTIAQADAVCTIADARTYTCLVAVCNANFFVSTDKTECVPSVPHEVGPCWLTPGKGWHCSAMTGEPALA